MEEISGVAYIFNQKFFKDLRSAAGIDLENIVYYKDDTHYFVMTAKKPSLLNKAVILNVSIPRRMRNRSIFPCVHLVGAGTDFFKLIVSTYRGGKLGCNFRKGLWAFTIRKRVWV